MPTIKQLPVASSVSATDVLPISQGGTTRSLTVAGLLSSTQAALSLVPGKVLGRGSLTAGGPESLSVGPGLSIGAGVIAATGEDHLRLPIAPVLGTGDEVVLNSDGAAKRLPATALRGLFSAGTGVTIDGAGRISAPAVGVPGPPGPVIAATAVAIGAVRPGTGLAVALDGTLSADAAALSSHLGLGGAATRNVGAGAGTVAAGDDGRITGALQAGVAARSYFPSAVVSGGGSAEMQAAQDAQQAVSGGLITVRSGTYQLASNVYTAGTNCWLFQRGSSVSGAGQIDAVTDGQALGSSGLTLARLLSASGNEHGLHVTARLGATSGSTGYEKAGVYVRLLTHDPSNYTNGVLRDAVAFEGQVGISPGNMRGRVWGINTGAGPDAGADGYAVGGEFGVQSLSGSPAGGFGTPTSKIGVHVVAYGNSSSTAAVVLSGNGTTWQDGVVALQEAIDVGGHAFSVRPTSTSRAGDVAWIGRDGAAQFSSLGVAPGGQVVFQSKLTSTVAVALPAGLTLDGPGSAYLFWDGGQNRLVFAYNGARLWSVDTSGNFRAAGTISGSVAP